MQPRVSRHGSALGPRIYLERPSQSCEAAAAGCPVVSCLRGCVQRKPEPSTSGVLSGAVAAGSAEGCEEWWWLGALRRRRRCHHGPQLAGDGLFYRCRDSTSVDE